MVLTGSPKRASDMAEKADSSSCIKVVLRIRPASSKETSLDHQKYLKPQPDNRGLVVQVNREKHETFTYDYIADEATSQEEIFCQVGRHVAENCVSGYNGTVFAYGQTGSGKTFTMQGPVADTHYGEVISESPELRGLIPRTLEYLFTLIARESRMSGGKTQYLCKCSFLEIYNENITDLLEPTSQHLHIREDIKNGVFVENLIEEVVQSPEDACRVIQTGFQNRRVGETSMNAESSRSHSVFTMVVESKSERADGVTNIRRSRLNLIDLAGSERQALTGATGATLKEASNINKSLSALGKVISALVDISNGKSRHVHYRDSKLTFLLKDSLGGNTKTCIIATVSPSDACFGETLSTLKFAQRAKHIRNQVYVNEDSNGSLEALQAEVRRLKQELANKGGSVASSIPMTPAKGSSDFSIGAGGDIAANAPRLITLEEVLMKQLDSQALVEKENASLQAKVTQLYTLVDQRDRALQSRKMQLRFKEEALLRLRASSADHADYSEEMNALREEMDLMKVEYNHPPELTRMALELSEAQEQVEFYEEHSGDAYNQYKSDLKKEQSLSRELRKQIRELVKEKHALIQNVEELEKRTVTAAAAATPARSSGPVGADLFSPGRGRGATDLEKWKAQQNFDEEISLLRKEKSNVEHLLSEARLQRDTLEGELKAALATKRELENSIASFKLKNDVLSNTANSDSAMMKLAESEEKRVALETRVDELQKLLEEEKAVASKVAIEHESVMTAQQEKATRLGEQTSFLEIELRKMKAQLEEAQRVIDESQEAAENLSGQDEQLKKTIDTLTAELTAKSTAYDKVSEELQTIQDEHEVARSEYEYRCSQAEQMTKQLQESEAARSALSSELETLNAANAEQSSQLMALQSQMSLAASDNDNAALQLMEENGRMAEKISALRAEAEEYSKGMQASQEIVKGTLETIADLRQSDQASLKFVMTLKQQMAVVQSKADERKRDAITLKKKLDFERDRCAELTEELDETKESMLLLQDRLDKVSGDCESMEAAHRLEVAELMAELQNQRNLYKSASEDLEISKAKITDCESQLAEADTVATERDSLVAFKEEAEAAIKASNGEIADLKASIEAHLLSIRELEESLATSNRQLDNTKKQLDTLRQSSEETEGEKASATAALQGLRADLSIAEDEIAQLKKQCSASRDEVKEKSEEIVNLKAEILSLEEKVSTYSKLTDEMEAAREKRQGEYDFLKKESMEVAKSLKTAVAKVADLKKREGDLQKQLALLKDESVSERDSLNSQMVSLEGQLVEMRKNLEESHSECERHKKQVLTVQGCLEVSLKEREESVAIMERVKAEEEAAFREKEAMRSQLEGVQARVSGLETQVADLSSKNEELIETNSKLIGHQNLKQKIQHHVKIKEENNALREEKQHFLDDISNKDLRISKLEREILKLRKMEGAHDNESIAPIDLLQNVNIEEALQKSLEMKEIENKQLTSDLNRLCAEVHRLTEAGGLASVNSNNASNAEGEDTKIILDQSINNLEMFVAKYQEQGRLIEKSKLNDFAARERERIKDMQTQKPTAFVAVE